MRVVLGLVYMCIAACVPLSVEKGSEALPICRVLFWVGGAITLMLWKIVDILEKGK